MHTSTWKCDVLSGEHIPSFTQSGQIQNWKVLHMRFVEILEHPMNKKSLTQTTNKQSTQHSEPTARSPPKSSFQNSHLWQTTSVSVRPSQSVVHSVSLSQLLKLGKFIVPDIDVVSFASQRWSGWNLLRCHFHRKENHLPIGHSIKHF